MRRSARRGGARRSREGLPIVSKRILIVDDNEDNRQILTDLLTAAKYEVIEAVTGRKP